MIKSETPSGHSHQEHLTGIENYVKSAAELTQQLLGQASAYGIVNNHDGFIQKPFSLKTVSEKVSELLAPS